jgi:trehalose-phosphatase
MNAESEDAQLEEFSEREAAQLEDPPEAFWQALARAPRRVLFLDYDGTLAPFRSERDKAYPYAQVAPLLPALRDAARTRLVLVTGRWSKDLLPLLGLEPPPEIWGSHGLERVFPDGRREEHPVDELARRVLDEAFAWLGEQGWSQYGERKPGCVALHWRGLPMARAAELQRQTEQAWSRLAAGLPPERREARLELRPFDGGLELRCAVRTKGDAVRTVLSEEDPRAIAAYLGDDLTDEDAFLAIAGRGLGVLVRSESRPTAAGVWLTPPEDLVDFLRKWVHVCQSPS